jgi:hypothetical protein
MPEFDAVLAITAGVANMQAVLNLVWEHLLPAMADGPLETDIPAREELTRKLAGLKVAPPAGEPASAAAREVSGRTYSLAANDLGIESIALEFAGDRCALTVRSPLGSEAIACGNGAWLRGETTLDTPEPQPVAAAGAWTANDTYVAKLIFYETPFVRTATCRFGGEQLATAQFDLDMNVSFAEVKNARLVGTWCQ